MGRWYPRMLGAFMALHVAVHYISRRAGLR